MGGRLTASSSVGMGSTFRFTVQFELAPPNNRKVQIELGDFHGRRVLLIDDNATNCLILRETLNTWGLESVAFRLPEAALAGLSEVMAGERPYSLVLVDSFMPGMDGFKARAKTLREGLEPELSLSIDAMYPMCVLTEAVGSFVVIGSKFISANHGNLEPKVNNESRT